MRKIAFRASITDNKGNHQRWAYGTPEFGDMGQLYIFVGVSGRFLCERDTLGQFTGLKDQNGKEIYEGDVVRSYHERGEVIYHLGSFGCFFNPQDFTSLETIWDRGDGHKVEIIGNIYENSDLLTNSHI